MIKAGIVQKGKIKIRTTHISGSYWWCPFGGRATNFHFTEDGTTKIGKKCITCGAVLIKIFEKKIKRNKLLADFLDNSNNRITFSLCNAELSGEKHEKPCFTIGVTAGRKSLKTNTIHFSKKDIKLLNTVFTGGLGEVF